MANPSKTPPLAVTTQDTLAHRTGAWRYLIPRFVRRFAPCAEACPAGGDPAAWLALFNQGRPQEALDLILAENPLPGVCGRVCAHPCQAACNRNRLEGPVNVRALERYLADNFSPSPISSGPKRGQKAAVVGSGPAGLSAAYHLARLGYGVTILEQADQLGGLLRQGIPSFRLPRDVVDREIGRILDLGLEVRTNCRVGPDPSSCDLTYADLDEYQAVILAVGAWRSLELDRPGFKGPGVRSGLDCLREANSGQDKSLDGPVVVIGGGNTALDCARTSLRRGGRPVVVYRRERFDMPALAEEIAQAEEEGIEILCRTEPLEAVHENGILTGLKCIGTRPGRPDSSGRPRPMRVEGTESVIPAMMILTAVGEEVDQGSLPPGLALDQGVIQAERWGRTGREGFFVCGDAGPNQRLVVRAMGSGKRAALAVHAALSGLDLESLDRSVFTGDLGSFSLGRVLNGPPDGADLVPTVVRPEEIETDLFQPCPGYRPPELEACERVCGFEEIVPGMDRDQAELEAERCLSCGLCDGCGRCVTFCPDLAVSLAHGPGGGRLNEYYCKGCGICAEECPRGAVVMEIDGKSGGEVSK